MSSTADRKGMLNGICPYFTMFPIRFPLSVLQRRAIPGQWVLDPFCGRGTTNLAARLLGLPTQGIDSHPLAVAISHAKLLSVTPDEIMDELNMCLSKETKPRNVPNTRFWELAYHESVLKTLCVLREAFLDRCDTAPKNALRAIILGALHGPLTPTVPSHFSNQSPRTYAPKPAYAVRFWESRGLCPPCVDIRKLVLRRATRFFSSELQTSIGNVWLGDARRSRAFIGVSEDVHWFITSPPYYGMRTYMPDQWLRLWFLGGADSVDYCQTGQLKHSSPEIFAADLHRVWSNCAKKAVSDARLVIRFGGINDRRADPFEILQLSLRDSGWRIQTRVAAGSAREGRRQADSFSRSKTTPQDEFDLWTIRE